MSINWWKKKSMLASPCPRFNTNFPRLHYNESQSKMKSLQAWAMNVSMCVPGASHRWQSCEIPVVMALPCADRRHCPVQGSLQAIVGHVLFLYMQSKIIVAQTAYHLGSHGILFFFILIKEYFHLAQHARRKTLTETKRSVVDGKMSLDFWG